MFKYLLLLFAICTLACCKETPVQPGNAANPPAYKKSDLQKLRWIEGNWKSDVGGQGYYQTYQFPSDSTLNVISYQFNGQDTSTTTISTVYWKNDHFYIGPNGEFVAVLLDKKRVQFDPIREGWLSINWTQKSANEFTAVQQKPTFTRTIKMIRQPPLDSLLKK